jgi:hypothetical protein
VGVRKAMLVSSGDAESEHRVVSIFINEKISYPLPLRPLPSRHKRKKEDAERDGRGKTKMPRLTEIVYPLPESRRKYLPREAATYR